jgi:MFS family permease
MFNFFEKKTFKKQKMFLFLLLLTVAATLGLQLWRTLYNNFAVEVVGLDGFQNGVVQSLREIPGFLSLLVVYLLLIFKEHKLAAFSVLLFGFGIAVTGLLPTYAGLILSTLLLSTGYHYFETLNQSLTLQYFDTKTAPLVFGRMRSLTSVASLVVGLAVFLLSDVLSYQTLFLACGILVILIGLFCLLMKPATQDITPQRKGTVIKRKYWLFYTLTFLAGARRQVFVAFAVFLLVKNFGFTIRTITLLFVLNNAINYVLSPLIGKAIVRLGERWVLSLEYASLIFIFLAYAYTKSAWVVGTMYVLDQIFFNFGIAIRTYFQKIGELEDIAPSMALGFTINHIAAVIIPVLGGWLWLIDYKLPFIIAACLSLVSLIATQFIKPVADFYLPNTR